MNPGRCGGRRKRLHALGEKPEHDAGEHIAAARCGQLRRCVRVDRSSSVRRGDHGIGTLQQHHRAALPRRAARPLGFVAGRVEEARKLARMGGHHAGRADGREQCVGIFGE